MGKSVKQQTQGRAPPMDANSLQAAKMEQQEGVANLLNEINSLTKSRTMDKISFICFNRGGIFIPPSLSSFPNLENLNR